MSIVLRGIPANVGTARQFARASLAGCPRADDLVLAVSELAANAHAWSATTLSWLRGPALDDTVGASLLFQPRFRAHRWRAVAVLVRHAGALLLLNMARGQHRWRSGAVAGQAPGGLSPAIIAK